MNKEQERDKKPITLTLAMIPILVTGVALGLSVLKYDANPHGSFIVGGLVAGIVAYIHGYSLKEIEQGLKDSVSRAIPSLIILLIIGMIISVWIGSGIVPALIYYGMDFIVSSWFLPSIFVLCCFMSVLTGSSWTTVGTVGVAAIGMGQGLGIPAAPIAGAVVSGAFFGDKLSPLSDSTNLTAAIMDVELYEHIKHMVYTTLPAAVISLILFAVTGYWLLEDESSINATVELQSYIQENFQLSLWLFIPPVIIIALILKKTPPIPSLMTGVLLGTILQVVVQGQSIEEVLQFLYFGFSISTGQESFDSLLSSGGIESMYSVVVLGILSLGFGGVMQRTGMLKVIVDRMKQFVKSQGRLIVTTVTTSLAINIVGANQYLAVILPGQMYVSCYNKLRLHKKNLTRALESGGTLTAPLIPWNTSGVFVVSVLNVDALAYVPFAFVCWITMIITSIYGYADITMEKKQ